MPTWHRRPFQAPDKPDEGTVRKEKKEKKRHWLSKGAPRTGSFLCLSGFLPAGPSLPDLVQLAAALFPLLPGRDRALRIFVALYP